MKIHHIALSVRSLENSSDFYKNILGFIEIKRFERKDLGGKSVFLRLGDVKIEMWQLANQKANKDDFSDLNVLGIKHIAFEVENIEEKYKELKSKGIRISEPKIGASGKRYCFLKDPDGFPLELYEK